MLEATYRYVLEHGLVDLSLRPLAAAIGSSPRVLMFLFGNKDGLIRAVLNRACTDELEMLERLRATAGPARPSLADAVEQVWRWLADDRHRALLRVWAEAYARSMIESDGPWGGFAQSTVRDWLDVFAEFQPEPALPTALAQRTLALAVLRGALLDLLATGDDARAGSAVDAYLLALRSEGR